MSFLLSGSNINLNIKACFIDTWSKKIRSSRSFSLIHEARKISASRPFSLIHEARKKIRSSRPSSMIHEARNIRSSRPFHWYIKRNKSAHYGLCPLYIKREKNPLPKIFYWDTQYRLTKRPNITEQDWGNFPFPQWSKSLEIILIDLELSKVNWMIHSNQLRAYKIPTATDRFQKLKKELKYLKSWWKLKKKLRKILQHTDSYWAVFEKLKKKSSNNWKNWKRADIYHQLLTAYIKSWNRAQSSDT